MERKLLAVVAADMVGLWAQLEYQRILSKVIFKTQYF